MTTAEGRNATVAHIRSRGGWVPGTEVATWLRRQLHLTRKAGAAELRHLVDTGRLQRRATVHTGPYRRYEYRAVTP